MARTWISQQERVNKLARYPQGGPPERVSGRALEEEACDQPKIKLARRSSGRNPKSVHDDRDILRHSFFNSSEKESSHPATEYLWSGPAAVHGDTAMLGRLVLNLAVRPGRPASQAGLASRVSH